MTRRPAFETPDASTATGHEQSATPVEVIMRWELVGGTWRVLDRAGQQVTVSLCRCDSGEEQERITSTDPALIAWLGDRADNSSGQIASTFVEVVGRRGLPDGLDRDDVEDLLADVLGSDGEITGAGVGAGIWNLDIEIAAEAERIPQIVQRMAAALVGEGLDWVSLRLEGQENGVMAGELAGR